LVIAVLAGHRVEVDKGRSHEQDRAETGNQKFKTAAAEAGDEQAAHKLNHHRDQQADDPETDNTAEGLAIGSAGIGAVGTAALATGLTFVVASVAGRRMSDSVGQALSGVVGLGIVGLLIAMVVQLVGSLFVPGFGGGGFELLIAGFGTVLFVGAAFVDFYTMPRQYRDDQYLVGALGMYLTYINLFIFILRLIIALNGGARRD